MKNRAIVMTEEEYLSINGAVFMGGAEPALHKNIKNDRNKAKNIQRVSDAMKTNNERREELRKEYAEKVACGEIRKPTRIERLKAIAAGCDDNESVQAARRLLKKIGIVRCPHCKDLLQESSIPGYSFYCENCDEDFYSIEVSKGDEECCGNCRSFEYENTEGVGICDLHDDERDCDDWCDNHVKNKETDTLDILSNTQTLIRNEEVLD